MDAAHISKQGSLAMLLTSAAAHAHAPAPEHALGAPSYAASLVSRSSSRATADNDAAAASSAEPLDADLYYINLQRRPDRNAALLRQLDRVGYDRAHVHRINATAHADGAAGCLLSHVAALEAVVARAAAAGGGGGGRPVALVLEDDFEWSDAAVARERLRAAFALQANWSVILLACRGVPAPLRDGALAGRYESAAGCFTTSGYMIRTSYAPKLLERFRSADRARRAPGGSASRSWVADGSRPTRLERLRAHARTAHHPVRPPPRGSPPHPPARRRRGVAAAAETRRLAHDESAPRPPGRRLQRHRAPARRVPIRPRPLHVRRQGVREDGGGEARRLGSAS